MSHRVVLSPSFKESLKRLKKFPHLESDLKTAISTLQQTPRIGRVISHGSGLRKVRIKNSDLQKGKSGGYRLIYFTTEHPESTIYLLLIYSKLDKADVTRREVVQLLQELSDLLLKGRE